MKQSLERRRQPLIVLRNADSYTVSDEFHTRSMFDIQGIPVSPKRNSWQRGRTTSPCILGPREDVRLRSCSTLQTSSVVINISHLS